MGKMAQDYAEIKIEDTLKDVSTKIKLIILANILNKVIKDELNVSISY